MWFLEACGAKFRHAGTQAEARRISGFLYSEILLCRNPSSLSQCICFRVEQKHRYAGIYVDVLRVCGFLFCEISLYRNPEAPRQVTWIFARRNCAIEESRSATEIHMRTRGCILFKKTKRLRPFRRMNLHMNLPPFICESCFRITWIENFDAWFKNGLWLQRQWHFSRHKENNIMKKNHARHRSYSNFHPPLKMSFLP